MDETLFDSWIVVKLEKKIVFTKTVFIWVIQSLLKSPFKPKIEFWQPQHIFEEYSNDGQYYVSWATCSNPLKTHN